MTNIMQGKYFVQSASICQYIAHKYGGTDWNHQDRLTDIWLDRHARYCPG